MFRLITIFAIVAGLAFGALSWSGGRAHLFLDQPIAIVVAISVLVGALSMAFHAFIDGVVKDLPEKAKIQDEKKRADAIEALSALRREVVENAMLVLVMLVLYATLSGSRGLISAYFDIAWLDWALLSFQFACLVVIIFGAVVQFLGFRVATTLRDVLARNR